MRIAMVTSWRVPCGIARYTEELVNALQQLPDFSVAVLPAGPQVWQAQGLRLGWWRERKYWREVARQTVLADIVHVQFAPHLFGGFKPFRNLLPFFLRCLHQPVVITVHEVDLTGAPLKRSIKLWVQRRLFRSASVRQCIALNRFVADQLQALGYKAVTVIPMWVPRINQRCDVEVAKQRLGLTGKFVVTAFGFIVARRGYELLLDALMPLPDDVLLVFAGGPHPLDKTGYYERWMQRIAEHPRRRKIHVTGYLPDGDVDLWLAASDVIVATFRQLSGSASLMRALAHSKPIVTSDLPPLRELAEASGAVLLFPEGDVHALTETLLWLRRDEALRRQLAAAADEFAQRNTVAEAARQHQKLYALVSGVASAPCQ